MPGNLFFKKDKPSDRFHKSLDRQPCVAGQFYPASAKELKADLKSYFNIAAPPESVLQLQSSLLMPDIFTPALWQHQLLTRLTHIQSLIEFS